jgi:NAD+ diphosphatase
MIQEIEPRRFDNAFKLKKPTKSDFFLHYESNRLLLKKDEQGYSFPTFELLPEAFYEDAYYLFAIDDMSFFLLSRSVDTSPELFEFCPVQSLREYDPRWIAFAALTGWQLNRWKENHGFCSRCGTKTEVSTKERAYLCPACGFVVYPRISPAVIVAVINGEKILMINNKNAPPDRYHLIAGFVEIGETLEQAVSREVMEEAGVKIKNIRYYKNQPWSVSDTLMVGFLAELDGDDTLTPEESEISDAKWFLRAESPTSASSASIGGEITRRFINGTL